MPLLLSLSLSLAAAGGLICFLSTGLLPLHGDGCVPQASALKRLLEGPFIGRHCILIAQRLQDFPTRCFQLLADFSPTFSLRVFQGVHHHTSPRHNLTRLERPLWQTCWIGLFLLNLCLEQTVKEERDLVHRFHEQREKLRGLDAELRSDLVRSLVLTSHADERHALHLRQLHAIHPPRKEKLRDGWHHIQDEILARITIDVLLQPMDVVT
mmetsp:Transcript_36458/g.97026  ORF Transcript_36458/g.97026 Transcript_36458/m.97026 type:complete len:211 (+) Transcript_36458:415-1047(+)